MYEHINIVFQWIFRIVPYKKTGLLLLSLALAVACKKSADPPIIVQQQPEPFGQPMPDPSNEEYTNDPCWSQNVLVKRNNEYNDYFTRYTNGWTGGDATYSIPIDESTNLWVFGDTFLGTVKSDRSRDGGPLINNTIVKQTGEEFTTFYGGTANAPEAFLRPPETDWWYWPAHGQLHNGQVQLLMFAMQRTQEGGMWGFEYAAIDLVTLSLPNLMVVSYERKMLFQGTNYGACLLRSGEYTYIYGSQKIEFDKFMHVARVAGTDLSQDWEFYGEGDAWTTDVSRSKSIFGNVSDQFSVIERPNGFYLITQEGFLGAKIQLFKANIPTGPFTSGKTLYCTPETVGNIFTYNAFVHEQFSTDGNLFISYNNNSLEFSDVLTNADNYRPHFINVKGWY